MKRAVFLSRLPPIPGAASAEAIGDYGAGPNHVLPTSQTARHTAGLSGFNFLRARNLMMPVLSHSLWWLFVPLMRIACRWS